MADPFGRYSPVRWNPTYDPPVNVGPQTINEAMAKSGVGSPQKIPSYTNGFEYPGGVTAWDTTSNGIKNLK